MTDQAKQFYHDLMQFLQQPDVWKALGTDEQFKQITQTRHCVVCGDQDYTGLESGEMKCEAAHVRRSANSGTAFKPKYAYVPMDDECHNRYQHHKGESAAYLRHLKLQGKTFQGAPFQLVNAAKSWFLMRCAENMVACAVQLLKEQLHVEHLQDIEHESLVQWAAYNGVYKLLPETLRKQNLVQDIAEGVA